MSANDKSQPQETQRSGMDALQRRFKNDLSTIETTVAQNGSRIHGFLHRFLLCKSRDDATTLNQFRDIVRRARSVVEGSDVFNSDNPKSGRIPKIIHRIWLTDTANPAEPPQAHIQKMINESKEYADSGWQLWFWTADPERLPNTVRQLQANNAQIILKNFAVDVLSGQPWEKNFENLLAERKFAFASDLLRMKLLYQYGGIYADMGARFRERGLTEFVVEKFDYSFIFWETLFFQNSLMMMAPNSPIGKLYMEIANDPYLLPKSLFYPLDGLEEGMAFSGLLITALLLFSNPETLRICPLAPNREVVEWVSERSWYTRSVGTAGKFGGAYIPETGATFLRKEGFQARQPLPIFLP